MIYFVQCNAGPIKIGYVEGRKPEDVVKRVGSLQTGNPYELKLLGVMEGKTGTEKSLHVRFQDIRIRGEWFQPDPALMTLIQEKSIPINENLSECVICREKFIPQTDNNVRCSEACARKSLCIICGAAFTPETWRKRFYCGMTCYYKGH